MFRLWGGAMLAIAACSDVTNSGEPEPSTGVDETLFKCNVDPILARQCSYNACHGLQRPDVPVGEATATLRIFTPGKLRQTPTATIDDAIKPLTDAEHHANFLSAAGFSYAAPSLDQNFLLRKPLPSDEGGFEHKGGAIYSGTDDPQYQAIFAWLSGTGACK